MTVFPCVSTPKIILCTEIHLASASGKPTSLEYKEKSALQSIQGKLLLIAEIPKSVRSVM